MDLLFPTQISGQAWRPWIRMKESILTVETEKTRLERYSLHFCIHLLTKDFNSYKFLYSARGTMKYGQLNWQNLMHLLAERHKKNIYDTFPRCKCSVWMTWHCWDGWLLSGCLRPFWRKRANRNLSTLSVIPRCTLT